MLCTRSSDIYLCVCVCVSLDAFDRSINQPQAMGCTIKLVGTAALSEAKDKLAVFVSPVRNLTLLPKGSIVLHVYLHLPARSRSLRYVKGLLFPRLDTFCLNLAGHATTGSECRASLPPKRVVFKSPKR